MLVRMEIGGLHEEDIKGLERECRKKGWVLEEVRLESDVYHYKAVIRVRI